MVHISKQMYAMFFIGEGNAEA